MYETLNTASFNVGNPFCCKVQKYNHSLVNFEAVADLDLILRKNEEARNLDVDRFHNMIRSAQDDQILKVLNLKSSAVSGNIMNLNIHPSDTWGAKEQAFASHYRTASGILVVDSWLIVSHCQIQRIKTIPNDTNPERQFLNKGLCAMLKARSIPPQDAFSMTEFDVVTYHNRDSLGKGGFGEVFEGNWHGTKVAIKRIRNFHPAVSRTTDSFGRYSYVPSLLKMRSTS